MRGRSDRPLAGFLRGRFSCIPDRMRGNRKGRGYAALRRGRVSLAGATYFLTLCIAKRWPCLDRAPVLASLFVELGKLEGDATWRCRCAMAMPDHLHLLVELGGRLTLPQVVGRLKAKTKTVVASAGATWQEGFFDHRVDPDEDLLPLFCYLYRNPYRAGFAGEGERWVGWWCCPDDWDWFRGFLDHDDLPPPQWLGEDR